MSRIYCPPGLSGPINPALAAMVSQLGGQVGNSLTPTWFYVYSHAPLTIPNGQVGSATIQIDSGTDFLVQAINLAANISPTTTPAGVVASSKITRLFRDTIAGQTAPHLGMITFNVSTQDRPWFNTPVRADLVTGEPGSPGYLPTMAYVAANDSLQVTYTNNLPAVGGVAAPAIVVQAAFIGIKNQRVT